MALEIKAGAEYRTVSGKKVGPAVLSGMGGRYPFNVPHNGYFYGYTADGKSCIGRHEDNLISEWNPPIESPIRTVTRREPVGGKYSNGDVDVSVHPDGQIQISVSMLTLKGDRVRSACMVLSQLAEFLDEDKGDE